MTKKQLFNAKNSGRALEEGLQITVAECETYQDGDKKVGVLKADDGTMYTTISQTVIDSFDDLSDIIAEDGPVSVTVECGVSNSGRKYYQLHID